MGVRKTSHSDAFTPRQRRAALLIASGSSMRVVAAAAGVSTRAVYKWLDQPAYVRLIATERDRILSRVIGKLVRSAVRAAGVLDRMLKAMGEPGESTRVRTAQVILESMTRVREAGELSARLAALEEKLAEREAQP